MGTGIVPEGFFQNEIVYDYTLQLQYNGYDDDYFVENWIMARYNLTYNKGLNMELITSGHSYFSLISPLGAIKWSRKPIRLSF